MPANWVVPKNALNSAMEVIQKITYRGILCVSANKIWFFTLLFIFIFLDSCKGLMESPKFPPKDLDMPMFPQFVWLVNLNFIVA